MKLYFSRQFFEKYSYIKFHENLPSGSRFVPCRQPDGRTDLTKLIVALRKVANAPKTLDRSKGMKWTVNWYALFWVLLNVYITRKLQGGLYNSVRKESWCIDQTTGCTSEKSWFKYRHRQKIVFFPTATGSAQRVQTGPRGWFFEC